MWWVWFAGGTFSVVGLVAIGFLLFGWGFFCMGLVLFAVGSVLGFGIYFLCDLQISLPVGLLITCFEICCLLLMVSIGEYF